MNTNLRNWRNERKRNGLCIDCSSNSEPGRIRCKQCQEKQNAYINKFRKNNKNNELCRCGQKKSIGFSTCENCRIKTRKNYETMRNKRIKNNLCVRCGINKPVENIKSCTECYLKYTSMSHLKNKDQWIDLKNIFNKQKEICKYSGIKLILGYNTELDHIIPKSKGGKSELNNLQWLYSPVNYMKQDLTENEFLILCKKINENKITDV